MSHSFLPKSLFSMFVHSFVSIWVEHFKYCTRPNLAITMLDVSEFLYIIFAFIPVVVMRNSVYVWFLGLKQFSQVLFWDSSRFTLVQPNVASLCDPWSVCDLWSLKAGLACPHEVTKTKQNNIYITYYILPIIYCLLIAYWLPIDCPWCTYVQP